MCINFIWSDAEAVCQKEYAEDENISSVCFASHEDQAICHDLIVLNGEDFSKPSVLAETRNVIEKETGFTTSELPQKKQQNSIILKINKCDSLKGM